ncbi:hypothetical protein [Tabrizicola sp.]|uniref:phage late control D family protein n=1 Tax=Tabrizicola sp. TaxID=2005166 RepID=UPI00286D35D2|nr:hypothetical protein [Tabrizicola sp.]
MSLLSALLSPGFRQAASVLITTGPAATDIGPLAVMASNIELRVSRTEAAQGTITFDDRRGSDGRWMVADSGIFTRWQQVVISADFQTHTEEIFRGYITGLKPALPQNGGEAKLVIELQDDGVALSREHMRRVWGEDAAMADGDILTELIAPLGLAVASGSGIGQSSRALTQDGLPIVFLRERAKANGYEIIFAKGEVWFGSMRLDAAPQATIMVYAGSATNCLSFSVADDAQKPDAVAFDLAPRSEGATPITETVTPDLALLGTSPVADEGAGLGTPSVAKLTREGDETEEETRARAQAMVNEASFRIRCTGELDGTLYGHVMLPGLPVRVDGAGDRNGGLYYIDKVTHVFTPDGYRQQFEGIRNATGDSDTAGAAPLPEALSAITSLF